MEEKSEKTNKRGDGKTLVDCREEDELGVARMGLSLQPTVVGFSEPEGKMLRPWFVTSVAHGGLPIGDRVNH